MHRMVQRIEPEAVDAALQPETGYRQQRVLHGTIMDVELRLLLQERVHVVLAPPRIPGPGRAAEHRLPVVGRRAVGLRIGPDVPVGPVAVAARPAVAEPAVMVGCMGIDLVDDDFQAQCVGPRHQGIEIRQRAEHRIDIAIVRYVIAEIAHRRCEERRYPDRIDSQPGDIIQPLRDPGKIADAIAIAVLEAARIDLVDRGALPPRLVRFAHAGVLRLVGAAPLLPCRCRTAQSPLSNVATRPSHTHGGMEVGGLAGGILRQGRFGGGRGLMPGPERAHPRAAGPREWEFTPCPRVIRSRFPNSMPASSMYCATVSARTSARPSRMTGTLPPSWRCAIPSSIAGWIRPAGPTPMAASGSIT